MKTNSFDILKTMGERNLDIRLSTNFIEAQKTKQGGYIKIGVDEQTIMDLVSGKPLSIALLIWNNNQFEEIKSELDST